MPQAGRSIGRGMREFKEGISGQDDTPEQTQVYTPTAAPAAVAQAPQPAAPATATAQQPVIPTNTSTRGHHDN
ncbi:MAG: twin-arginine translocase TatA/TatE family subunit, partial [Solirubrobacteraceae bacterium]